MPFAFFDQTVRKAARMRMCALVFAFVLAIWAPGAARADELTVFAAASLRNALDEIAAAFEQEAGVELRTSYAATSALARQIQYGAPADIFMSAHTDWMDHLDASGLIDSATRIDILTNRLVLVSRDLDARSIEITPDTELVEMLDGGRLAMALIDAVPAGIYGREALTALGLWDEVAPFVAQTDNVRAALALVALGEAPLGVVYASDARAEPRVRVTGEFPGAAHAPIVYSAAMTHRRDSAAGAQFLDFLRGAEARAVFARWGFDAIAQ